MGLVVHILGAHEEARFLLELTVCGKGHPKGAKVVWRCIQAVGHAVLLAVGEAVPVQGLVPFIFTARSNYQRPARRQAEEVPPLPFPDTRASSILRPALLQKSMAAMAEGISFISLKFNHFYRR
jgi:hypothetical protein